VVLFSINTNSIASLNTYFSASAATYYKLVSFDGVGLAFYIDGLPRGIVIAPPS
jgi:hypothetical protein